MNWQELLRYSERFMTQADMAEEERNYKLALSAGLRVARQQLLDGHDQWFDTLRREINRTNLVNQYFMMALVKAGTEQPEKLTEAVKGFWQGTPDPECLDQLEYELRELNRARLSSGGAIGFGSLLLMAKNPEEYPPFRARKTAEFMRLIGIAPLKSSAKPSERYQQFLEVLDMFKAKSSGAGLAVADRLDAQGLLWTLMNVNPDDSWPSEEASTFRILRGDKVMPEKVEYVRGKGKSPEAEDAAWMILGPALTGGVSPIDGATQTWTDATAASLLLTRETQDPETGKFLDRLKPQLENSTNDVYLLTAELLYLQCVALSNFLPKSKVDRINTVLSWAPDSPNVLPPALTEALSCQGAFNGGRGFHSFLSPHLAWLLRFVRVVVSTSREDLDNVLSDPWKWLDFTASVPDDVSAIRYAIDYLVWPNYHQIVVVKEERKRIRDTFAHLIGGPRGNTELNIAQDLHDIRQVHNAEAGNYAEWYSEPYKSMWQSPKNIANRAWLVRQSQAGSPMAETWQAEGIVTLPSQGLPVEMIGENVETILNAFGALNEFNSHLDPKEKAEELHRFATQMREGDLVIAPWEDVILVGTVTGDAYIDEVDGPKFCRTVEWHQDPVDNANLPEPLPRFLSGTGNIIDVSEGYTSIRTWAHRPTSPEGISEPVPSPSHLQRAIVTPQLRNASTELALELHVDQDDLQEMIELLRTRRQVVFYGPPGTGKTFIGKRLAQFLAGKEHANHVQIVQFHPSYVYEDFFEGYRPSGASNGQVGFELQHGPLRRLAVMAAEPGNADIPFFLIIDEMNRGNLAKVFGELYFLLEYRNDSIRLQYSSADEFTLPPNLFIIGTMNTADRSIAMVDAAIRRRFAFIELHPQDGIVAETLGRFLKHSNQSTLAADLLNALNFELGTAKRDLAVGPSYFMKEDSFTALGLRRVWKYELLPLLEEYHFGELDRNEVHERFALDTLLSAIGRSLNELELPVLMDED